MAGELQCYRYCLTGSDCSNFGGATVTIPITVYESEQNDGYPSIYNTLFPNLYNEITPPDPSVVAYYLVDITDLNFAVENFMVRAIVGGLCSEPTSFPACDNIQVGDIVLDPNTIINITPFPNGAACPALDCRVLTNCAKPLETITLSGTIALYQGMVVALQEYPGKFWYVGEPTLCVDSVDFYTVVESYASCEDALPPFVEPYTRIEPKADRNFSAITVSEQDIRDNVRFGNAYYDLFRSLKYGINNFCDNLTLERTWMRKELSDMNQLLDPTVCTITTPVTPEVCVEPEGNPIPPEIPLT
jgi:hypothetical protein